ncbi:MAG: 1,4-dihydroxy-2-naphthoate polyprenyltransferase [Chlorobi bacterium]|nr:1,4-dihydroxy-2-naphthoate polyprenyltransferase [Chlorobiota bacterium]
MLKEKIKSWIEAFRLRTLPLSMSSVILGAALAFGDGIFSWITSLLAVSTTLFLQILSNLANDYGDYTHGLDNDERVGPKRGVQRGIIAPGEIKRAVVTFIVLTLISGILLIWSGVGDLISIKGLVFILLGILALAAAVNYTVGKHPYGYYGLGDLFVFIFFGLTGVAGTYYLNTHTFRPDILLPASALGFLTTGVLNLNNMRDMENDRRNGKITLAVLLGPKLSRHYHLILLSGAMVFSLIYVLLNYETPYQFIFLIIVPPLIQNVLAVYRNSYAALDPWLKKLSLTSLLYAITFGLGLLLH